MKIRRSMPMQHDSGQALMETVLIMPVLLAVVLNAINFAFFFLMALNITSSARSSGTYSIMGGATPATMTGAVYSPTTTNTGVQVCSPSVGVLNAGTATQQSQCSQLGMAESFAPADPDPELNSAGTVPAFLLNRVDVAYQFTPPIPLMPFNIIVLASPACTSSGGVVTCLFYRHTEMRAMN